MKKYLLIIIVLFLFTGCNKEYEMLCRGKITFDDDSYNLYVTIHYDVEDKVSAVDYEMIFEDEEFFKSACEESKDKNPKCENLTVSYTDSDEITKVRYNNNRVYINEEQYFDNVPEEIWNFKIGSYQPAQTWLKARKGRRLEYDEITHYQKLIKSLYETNNIMNNELKDIEF